MLRVTSLNLNGIRSAVSKGLPAWTVAAAPDVLCVQELKAQPPDLAGRFEVLGDLRGYFHCAAKKGYSGVGIYTRHEPSDVVVGIGVPEFDDEGRYLELRFDTPQRKLSVVSVYFPSGSSGDERQAAKYRFLDQIEPVLAQLAARGEALVCGDVNIAHTEKDLKNWRGNQNNSGFLPEERAWMTRLLGDGRWVDVYRRLHPDAEGEGYTWWSNRGQAWAKNVGWRIDYHLATPALAALARRAEVYKAQRFSDHAPLTIEYDTAL
ncbi:exodeoxyribonuclease III [Tepidimonas aquatica]|uniref:Exodeoxyribonuclease n=1 Tax=Tepidimonas aquatica TaxID=247482 RepID=A0A554WHR8_9BURK|nr:exodeoxyribonuclease III [Tepidimonas aquatica]TSE23121.1 Exodeoxyribonuclease [Tepidimonas aquatica]